MAGIPHVATVAGSRPRVAPLAPDGQEPSSAPVVLLTGASQRRRRNMFKSLDIQHHMEVVGSDGKHVGTVDHMEGSERILLAKDDPKAGGMHHVISIDWVDFIDA